MRRQICNLLPAYLVPKLARETGVEKKARPFSPWSHLLSLLHAQLTHAIGLHDGGDGLRLHSGLLVTLRGATPPGRNHLSPANKERDASLAAQVFWAVRGPLQSRPPGCARGDRGKGIARRLRRAIHGVDSTTIQLVAACMDGAKHRRRKAAAKCPLRLDRHRLLPRCALIDTARENDAQRSRELCAAIRAGELVVFAKADLDFAHLFALLQRGVFGVTRAKENLAGEVLEALPVTGRILRDEIVGLRTPSVSTSYPEIMRRITALVEIDGWEVERVFLTNNRAWSPASVADLYRCRWSIEAFCKQSKPTLQPAAFLGHSANAVRWRVWTALRVYVLLRFLAFAHGWQHRFTRLFTLLRSALWRRWDLASLRQSYGTAPGDFRFIATPQQPCFSGLLSHPVGQPHYSRRQKTSSKS